MALLRQRCTLNRSQMVPCFFPLLKSIALSSNLPNSTPNSQSFFSRIKSLVKTFIGGCKLLWTDLKISRDLIIKEKHEKLTRRETQFILQASDVTPTKEKGKIFCSDETRRSQTCANAAGLLHTFCWLRCSAPSVRVKKIVRYYIAYIYYPSYASKKRI